MSYKIKCYWINDLKIYDQTHGDKINLWVLNDFNELSGIY